MTETTSFGAALTAGKTIGLWDLKDHKSIPIYNEIFYCTLPDDGRSITRLPYFMLFYLIYHQRSELILTLKQLKVTSLLVLSHSKEWEQNKLSIILKIDFG